MSARTGARRRVPSVGIAIALLVSGCTGAEPEREPGGTPTGSPASDSPTPESTESVPQVTEVTGVLATGLSVPWDIDFTPDGAGIVTERGTGRLLRVGPEEDGDGLRVTEIQTIEVNDAGEGGLMGVAVSPDYQDDETIFLYYTTGQDNRIVRLPPGGEPEPILTGIPAGTNHNGGRIAFGPDGYLYASTGEAGIPSLAPDLGSLGGKILRLTADGEPAPGNPFDEAPLVWSYGHRNVQGLAWDADGRLWATEFGSSGQDARDEINLIEPGENYGWPEVEGIAGDDRFRDAEIEFTTSEASCSGAAIVADTLVAACLQGERLWLIDLAGGTAGEPQPLLEGEYGRLRAAAAAPDGALWVSTSNHDRRGDPHPDDDRILRLTGA